MIFTASHQPRMTTDFVRNSDATMSQAFAVILAADQQNPWSAVRIRRPLRRHFQNIGINQIFLRSAKVRQDPPQMAEKEASVTKTPAIAKATQTFATATQTFATATQRSAT